MMGFRIIHQNMGLAQVTEKIADCYVQSVQFLTTYLKQSLTIFFISFHATVYMPRQEKQF